MLLIDEVLLHDDVVDEQFACSLQSCKGACCVEGDGGAPLEPAEADILDEVYPQVKRYLTAEGRAAIERQGKWVRDEYGELETPLVGERGPCAYLAWEGGIALCGIEKAYRAGAVAFPKPVSCHLYPVRSSRREPYELLRYDRWDICSAACARGKAEKIPVYRFVKDALVRKYGQAFYDQLNALAEQRDRTPRRDP